MIRTVTSYLDITYRCRLDFNDKRWYITLEMQHVSGEWISSGMVCGWRRTFRSEETAQKVAHKWLDSFQMPPPQPPQISYCLEERP